MAKKPNYGFEKRRKELDRKNKKEEKAQRRRERAESSESAESRDDAPVESTSDAPPSEPTA